MKTAIDLFKKTLKYPVTWLCVIYLFWLFYVPIDEAYFMGIILFGIYLIITILVEVSSTNQKYMLALLVLLIPVAWVASVATIWLEIGWLDRQLIFTLVTILLASYPAIFVLRKHSNQNKLLSILIFVMTLPILTANIMYVVNYFPNVIDRAEFRNFNYYIISGIDMDDYGYRAFYKCKKWSFQCDTPYRTYFKQDLEKIIIDEENNEVSVIRSETDARLVFTYADKPRIYNGHPVKLGGQIYQISINYDSGYCATNSCDTYIYTLYACKSNYTSCSQLPIQYTTMQYVSIILSTNGSDKIYASDEESTSLLFSYEDHPACYVDGCVILYH